MKTFWKVFFASLLAFVVASIVITFISIAAIGSIAALVSSETTTSTSGNTILRLDFKAPVTEQSTDSFSYTAMGGPNFSSSIPIYKYVKAIDIAAEDDAVKFIYMTPDVMAPLSQSQAEEIRAALVRFRAAGKAIVSYSYQMTDDAYYMASVADKVMMNAYGDAMMFGKSASVVYLKDALDRLGVDVQLIRHGKYKSAGETFVQNTISPANREQNQAMVTSLWHSMVNTICESRDFTPAQYNSWIDNLELTDAPSMLSRKLVDELCYDSDVDTYLCSLFGVEDPDKLDFTDIADYAAAKVKSTARSKDKIAIVYCTGDIYVDGEGGNMMYGTEMAAQLAKIRKDSTVKAVVLRVNSPGGAAQGAEMINHELGLLKEVKPVIASFGDYAASGGYWISARTDKIYTDKSTLTGSIGVFSLIPNFGNALKKKVGVNVVTIGSNKHSDALTLMDRLDPSEEAYMLKMIEKVYGDFTSLVAEGRHMDVARVDELGQGRVWTGEQAVANGLADEIGGLTDAISYAAIAAGLPEGGYRIAEYPAAKTFAEKLIESLSKTKAAAGVAADPLTAIGNGYASLLKEKKASICARLPYIYEFN